MQETLKKLKSDISFKCNNYVFWNRTDLIKEIKPIIPDIQAFITQFLQTEDIGVEPNVKASMNADMLGILKDIVTAMEKSDSVLMYDALDVGLIEYLNLFVPEDEDE